VQRTLDSTDDFLFGLDADQTVHFFAVPEHEQRRDAADAEAGSGVRCSA
jgi:hypothetical protein